MSASARTETLVERSNLLNRARTKSHIRTEHAPYFDHFFAVIGDRQIEVHGHQPDFFVGIFAREYSPLHGGELAMRIEEIFGRREVTRRDRQIVVEEDQDFSRRVRDCAILNAAFAGAGFVQVLERRAFQRKLHRRRRAVLRGAYPARPGRQYRREAGNQPPNRVGPVVSRDDDRGLHLECYSVLRNRMMMFSSISRLALVMKPSSWRLISRCAGSLTRP